MKIYLAGRYSQKEELREFSEQAEQFGAEITSSWLYEPYSPSTTMDQLTPWELKHTALRDYDDIRQADVMVFFSCDPTDPTVRGGRHVEFGIAVALAKEIWVVGPKENIFHYLPWVEHTATKQGMLRKIKAMARFCHTG